jgi:hypothetical protein
MESFASWTSTPEGVLPGRRIMATGRPPLRRREIEPLPNRVPDEVNEESLVSGLKLEPTNVPSSSRTLSSCAATRLMYSGECVLFEQQLVMFGGGAHPPPPAQPKPCRALLIGYSRAGLELTKEGMAHASARRETVRIPPE